MKNKYKMGVLILILIFCVFVFSGCENRGNSITYGKASGTIEDTTSQAEVAGRLADNQRTPTDINYSLERYNLIRRTYWVNGQREKANMLVCPVEKPLGYIVIFAGNTVAGRFVVDGKVSSLNSFLTPSNIDTYYGNGGVITTEMADVDGSYGENDNGIFFFTPNGNYIEWTGEYLYSDIPFEIDNPIVKVVSE